MKKVILFSAICLAAFSATSQKYSDIKNLMLLNQFEKAKTEFDKAITNAKFAGNAEAYILKTAIYTGLASSTALKNTPDGAKYIDEAFTAFKKYKEMDASMALATDPIYQNGPVNLYSNLYSSGYDAYSKNNWQPAFEKLKSAVEMSDVLLGLKILTVPIDTNVLILAGITAEKSNNRDDAAKFYGRLADAKVTGDGFESVYRYMVSYSVDKKDMAAFERYKKLGIELFPKSEFFTYDKVDFAVGLAEGFENKKKALDEVLATDPTNYKANQILGEIIYDTLNSDKEGAVLPANAAELEKTMVSSFLKAAAAKPESEISYLYLGDHFINKASKINDARSAHVADMKNRTKPGTMASKEDVAKRDQLDAQYGEELEKAKEPYEKAAAMFAARVKANNGLELRDKEQYKKSINYLSEIAMFKRIQAKGKPADVTKYTAEEKKWNELYDTINAIPTLKKDH
ncbi:MAG: hypothetical protein IPN82_02330 [Chitinophagaceae bacterium]|nr:hypothetical protein [Chitinophagaceae bacterium]MBP7107566.1 hypothetical protein [Chitinophagaceae bacterium]MBP7316472.1 hypothetical protein [Chitinophagaceae bacterium]